MLECMHHTYEMHQTPESVMMGAIFHNYKQILQITKDDKINEDYLKEELVSLLDSKSEGKILFYRYSKK